MHIPKTGGSTLVSNVKKFLQEDEIWTTQDYLKSKKEINLGDKVKFAAGHFKMEMVIKFPEPRKLVTLVRNPEDRIISAYRYLRLMGLNPKLYQEDILARLAFDHNFEEFLNFTEVKESISFNNMFTRYYLDRSFCYVKEGQLKKITDSDLAQSKVNLGKFDKVYTSSQIHEAIGYCREICKIPLDKKIRDKNITDDLQLKKEKKFNSDDSFYLPTKEECKQVKIPDHYTHHDSKLLQSYL